MMLPRLPRIQILSNAADLSGGGNTAKDHIHYLLFYLTERVHPCAHVLHMCTRVSLNLLLLLQNVKMRPRVSIV